MYRLKPGQQIDLENMRVTVEETTEDGRPSRIVFMLRTSLLNPETVWLKWDWVEAMYQSMDPLSIGENRIIPGPFD
jgi:hypothetical protein